MAIALWTAAFFRETKDVTPERVGYIRAKAEDEAAETAVAHLGEAARVELTRVFLKPGLRVARGQLLHLNQTGTSTSPT